MAGIKKVIIPAKNKDDLLEIPENAKKGMQFFPVDTLEDVMKLAIKNGRKK